MRRFAATEGPSSVLVVDDDAVYREQLAIVLRRAGHRVQVAADGAQALQQMRRDPPGLVLLDLIMPGMDGLEVITAMRSDPALVDIQVVLVTAADVPDEVIRRLNERAVTLVSKHATDLDHIAARVHELLERAARPKRKGDPQA